MNDNKIRIPMTKVIVVDPNSDKEAATLYSTYTLVHPDNVDYFLDLYLLNVPDLDFDKYDPLYVMSIEDFNIIQSIPQPMEGFGETLYHSTWNYIKEESIRLITERKNATKEKENISCSRKS